VAWVLPASRLQYFTTENKKKKHFGTFILHGAFLAICPSVAVFFLELSGISFFMSSKTRPKKDFFFTASPGDHLLYHRNFLFRYFPTRTHARNFVSFKKKKVKEREGERDYIQEQNTSILSGRQLLNNAHKNNNIQQQS
jgi:hypothetical protein